MTPQNTTMDSITYEESIKYGRGVVAYDEVTDEEITQLLKLPNNQINDHKNFSSGGKAFNTSSIVYHVKLLMEGKPLNSFEVFYQTEEEYPHCADIYDGWHRIRAYQYMKYANIPCDIVKLF